MQKGKRNQSYTVQVRNTLYIKLYKRPTTVWNYCDLSNSELSRQGETERHRQRQTDRQKNSKTHKTMYLRCADIPRMLQTLQNYILYVIEIFPDLKTYRITHNKLFPIPICWCNTISTMLSWTRSTPYLYDLSTTTQSRPARRCVYTMEFTANNVKLSI